MQYNRLDTATGSVIIDTPDHVRATFIKKTYAHLAIAILLFALIEVFFFSINLDQVALKLVSVHQFAFFAVIMAYAFASHMIQRRALESFTLSQQYSAFFIGVLLEAVIFLPLLAIATTYAPSVLDNAVVITLALVVGISAAAILTGKDFSFLRSFISIGFMVALGIIIVSMLFGFTLGTIFSGAMIILASAAILYETSQIQHHYHETQYVGASLSLFAAVGTLFWYVVNFLMSFASSD